ncbi:P63C domain-containing protein [Gluconacetobacter entanii]|uniref:P63C domain-containing protein n=1 Tax=Gluconacetobacter entanii TaxID=108528 RepID=A0ABT3K4U0_9PROT|nr:P63C domain-containing protein [Gluconacetobacter entanii]MBY4639676.1 P63C domain-containing protein [Gluconacetobacter entanii]MCW4579628.1 P63C domain-containing protein [Gluconacetobacter entanii]MCW4583034.1 P63C domain-containing protein [Gluconacetobacter entanii]MCW4586461.1 P63C domain-containing protein [Gluconacetobacter entanii]MCW4590428.1 P63C domain-containing protein [Gluconacetobacter entanii]
MHKSGRAAGGKARKDALTPQRRSEIAKKAASESARLRSMPILRATHGSLDHPLRIGSLEIPCYVLEDGTRVITQTGVLNAMQLPNRGGAEGRTRLARFFDGKVFSPYLSKELSESTNAPIKFRTPTGALAYGYRAEMLVHLCEAILKARDEGLNERYIRFAVHADIIMRGLAHTGITALVDEATGYQRDRARDALATIFEAFVSKEIQKWIRRFPPEFYEHLFRLRNLPMSEGQKRPAYFGRLTNNIVYRRLAPGLLDELQRVNPVDPDKKSRRSTHHQRLTDDIGVSALTSHLGAVIALMSITPDGEYDKFIELLDKAKPILNVEDASLYERE